MKERLIRRREHKYVVQASSNWDKKEILMLLLWTRVPICSVCNIAGSDFRTR
jgi:hypothetical protein